MKTNTVSLTLISLLTGFAFLQPAQAVVPPPDGGYPGGNTAEGQKALQSLTTGGFNTAVGYFSLFSNTTGTFNTAVGAGALDLNTADNNTAVGTAALLLNTASGNTALGSRGGSANENGSGNVYIGAGVGGLFDENNTTRIRNIGSTPIVGGINVVIFLTG